MKTTLALKKIAALAAFTFASIGANAAITDLGALPSDSKFAKSFSGQVSSNGNFTDQLTFSLSKASDLTFVVGNFFVPSFFNLTLTSASLYANADTALFNADDLLLNPTSNVSSSAGSAYSALAAGTYYLQIAGNASGTYGGLYNGAINITTTSPVPEPETFVMMLAGLGLMGAVARRRNKKNDS